jgi:hypothetical protein
MARLGRILENLALVHVYLFGVAVQCLHFLEEYLTGFQSEYPPILGMAPWSDRFFVSLNLIALAVFVLAALGLLLQIRLAFVVIWVFAIAMTANGVVHPALSIRKGGYFPGTITAPLHLIVGITLLAKLSKAPTRAKVGKPAS